MKFQTVDISKTASAASLVFESLRRAIIEGDLKDGEALRQDEIARMFNTSRIPVREALTMLEQQGLVKIQRYKGAIVAGISPSEASEIFDFRTLLESAVIRAAVPKMSKETLAEAGEFCAAFSKSPDPMRWGDLNRDFHYALYRDSGLEYHLNVVNNALDRIDRYLRAQLTMTDGMERANLEHIAILEACEQGNADLAAERTAKHIQDAKATLLTHLESTG